MFFIFHTKMDVIAVTIPLVYLTGDFSLTRFLSYFAVIYVTSVFAQVLWKRYLERTMKADFDRLEKCLKDPHSELVLKIQSLIRDGVHPSPHLPNWGCMQPWGKLVQADSTIWDLEREEQAKYADMVGTQGPVVQNFGNTQPTNPLNPP